MKPISIALSREIHAAAEAMKDSAAFGVCVFALQDLDRLSSASRVWITTGRSHSCAARSCRLNTATWTSRGELS